MTTFKEHCDRIIWLMDGAKVYHRHQERREALKVLAEARDTLDEAAYLAGGAKPVNPVAPLKSTGHL